MKEFTIILRLTIKNDSEKCVFLLFLVSLIFLFFPLFLLRWPWASSGLSKMAENPPLTVTVKFRDEAPTPEGEYFDVLTPEGSLTGQRKLRSLVHRDGDWHRAVHIWIFHRESESILLQKRCALKDSYPSCWDVSCAGHLSAGENSLTAALNELREELGIEINTEEIGHSKDSLQFLTSFKRVMISQQGKFLDYEHTDIFLLEWPRKRENRENPENPQERRERLEKELDVGQFILQASEVESVTWIALKDYQEDLQRIFQGEKNIQFDKRKQRKLIRLQENDEKIGEKEEEIEEGETVDPYVPVPDFPLYNENVFSILAEKMKTQGKEENQKA